MHFLSNVPWTVAIALSGGVDSLYAAYLLKEQGATVVAFHFLSGYPKAAGNATANWDRAFHQRLEHLSRKLEIPLEIIDIHEPFERIVVRYFADAYAQGRTPNPCLICNPAIKFGLLMDLAAPKGIDVLATGHYARTQFDDKGHPHLFKAVDQRKDQSYFLAFLSPRQLARACFPIGHLTKKKVKSLAAEKGLLPATTGESQDICFIRDQGYTAFLENRPGFKAQPGPIETSAGKVIGRHNGLHHFTIGQRRGINCPAPEPYYVLRLDHANNRLVVGRKSEGYSGRCWVHGINWLQRPQQATLRLQVRLRYRHAAADAVVHLADEDRAEVCFDQPQSAVTPGQGAVFYQNDEVLGGAWIT